MTVRYRHRRFATAGVIAVLVTSVPALAQDKRAAATAKTEDAHMRRTAWGAPDLQGLWRPIGRSETTVPLERPTNLGTQEFWTESEIAAIKKRDEEYRQTARKEGGTNQGAETLVFFGFGYGVLATEVPRRTSHIVDPPNGRLPAWTNAQIKRFEARLDARRGRGEADSWLDRALVERCIVPVTARLLGNRSYNSPVIRIVQMPQYAVIVNEGAIPDAAIAGVASYRIVPLDGRPRLPSAIRQWNGDARGSWDGDVLVEQITNVNDQQDGGAILPVATQLYPGSGENFQMTTRYRLLDANTLEIRSRIEDPDVTRPITVVREYTRDDELYMAPPQCHENNTMAAMLLAGRAAEDIALENAQAWADRWRKQLMEKKAELAAEAGVGR